MKFLKAKNCPTMEEFQTEALKYFDVIDIDQLITDSVHSNRPYVSLDLTHMFNTSKQMFTTLTNDYIQYHNFLRCILQKRVHSLNFKQNLEPVYYNNLVLHSFHDLKCDKLHKLTTFRATVTRTSSVRPELSVGCFQCQDCYSYTTVLQKNRYTFPLVCSNPLCKNRSKFKLNLERSLFNDWQKVFCQESYTEAQDGSMPRTMVLYARNFCCEMLNPGDCLLVTGVLTIVEDDGYELVFMVNFVETEDLVSEKFERMLKFTQNKSSDPFLSSKIQNKEVLRQNENVEILQNNENVDTENYQRISDQKLQASVDSNLIRNLSNNSGQSTDSIIMQKTENYNPQDYTDKEPTTNLNTDLKDISVDCCENNEHIKATVKIPELKIVNSESYGSLLGIEKFILYMRTVPNLYTELAESLFPYIYGHTLIKHSILLLLAQGTRKKSKNMSIRGDINILLVGDPGTAKSQFLKETSKILPRSVYTSGKSASAAGLTACVIKDLEGEFTIEAGALMLSDKSVCCIDEFDKMDRTDRVSIHEAMEQGTITINKAGINATLNARCSVLAAANPIYGKYDESKTLRHNINLTDAIMSRFDLYFVVVDIVDEDNDGKIADRVIDYHTEESQKLRMKNLYFQEGQTNYNKIDDREFDLHTEKSQNSNIQDFHIQQGQKNSSIFDETNDIKISDQGFDYHTKESENSKIQDFHIQRGQKNSSIFDETNDIKIANQGFELTQNADLSELTNTQFKKPKFTAEEIREYILYIRQNIHPKLTKESKKAIVEKYIKLRQDSLINPTNYRVTIRQLESLIRLSEALAKIHCDENVSHVHVEEAYRLLKGSVIELKNEDVSIFNENINNTVSIERKEYVRIMSSMIYLLKTKDHMSCDELVNEYLLLREDKIESVDQFNVEESLAKVVLSHLINKEGVLYELDNKIHIHPNYDA